MRGLWLRTIGIVLLALVLAAGGYWAGQGQAQAMYHDALLRRTTAGEELGRQTRRGQLGEYGRSALLTARINFQQVQGEIQADKNAVNVQQPFATVVIGGLITSTFLTLFVLPTLYAWFEKDDEDKNDEDKNGAGRNGSNGSHRPQPEDHDLVPVLSALPEPRQPLLSGSKPSG